MTPERWQQISRVLQEALNRSNPDREAFLDEACAGDQDLRNEIQSLISSHGRAQDFLEVPALAEAAAWMADEMDNLLVGTLIGSYKIEARLGAGGMGEVYLARDTRLDRKVAIKFLPKALEGDELARRRLIREAKTAAGLDHPNICGIYEVATHANHSFIVMQYVEGETLAAMLRSRAMPLSESVATAIEIADALAFAHSRGVVHRDIKPQNIMITPRGQVKVLDFGVAKIAPASSDERPRTRESELSKLGLAIGTPPYMSPEQVRGEMVDSRSDLFSLGALLYECVTRRPAFSGNTPMEIYAQVIHVDPPYPSAVNADVPPELDRIILKALAKDRDSRYQSAEEVRRELTAVRDSLGDGGAAVRWRPIKPDRLAKLVGIARRPRVLIPVAVMMLAALSAPVWRHTTPYSPPPEALQWYERGTGALRDGTYYKASKALEQAITFDDKFALAHARLAEAWSELDYADKANREILRARSLVHDLSPLPPLDALYLQAITHVVLQEFGSATEAYRKIADQAPVTDKAQAYVDLGRVQEKNDEVEKARKSYEQAAALATQDAAAYLRLGVLQGRQQDLDGASQAFQTAEKLYRALSNVEGEAEVFYQRGFLFLNLKKLREARAQLDEALRLSSTPLRQYQQIRILLALSGVSVAEGYPSQAEQQATQAIQLARDAGIENQATSGLIFLGNVFLNRGGYSEAEERYTQALELAQRDNGRLNEAVASFSLGSLRSQQRRTDEALRYVEQALSFLKRGGYRKWLSQALTLLGRVHRDRGEYDAALHAVKEQLSIGEQVGDRSQVALALAEIGSILARQEQYSEALTQFDGSETISRSMNAKVSVGYALTERADLLWQIGRFEEAKRALDEAAAIARPGSGYKALLAAIEMTDARLELGAGHFIASKMRSHRALDLARDQYADTAAQATLTLGLAETRSGGERSGMRLCAEAVEMAIGTGDPQLISSARLAFAEALLYSGEPKRALETAQWAQESFARFGQLDSEWRAWLLASESSQRLGEEAAAREHASTAAARLASLEQRFGPETYSDFVTRPDVQRLQKRLSQLRNP